MNDLIDLAIFVLIAFIAWNVLSLLVTLLVWAAIFLREAVHRVVSR
jgi:hypothetical protein